MKEKSLYYFHKKLKILKKTKKTQKNPFLVGFFRWVFLGFFWWVFLGGFFWVGFLMPTLPLADSDETVLEPIQRLGGKYSERRLVIVKSSKKSFSSNTVRYGTVHHQTSTVAVVQFFVANRSHRYTFMKIQKVIPWTQKPVLWDRNDLLRFSSEKDLIPVPVPDSNNI